MSSDNVIKWCDNIMLFALCAVAYFAPISVALIESFFPVALVAYLVKRGVIFGQGLKAERPATITAKGKLFLKSYQPVDSPIRGLVGLYILGGLLSALFSHFPVVSLKAFVFKILQDTFTFYLLVEATSSRKRLQIFLTVLFISVTLITFNGYSQAVFGKGFVLGNGLTEGLGINSTLNHPNDFGGYLNLIIPLLLGFALFSNHRFVRLGEYVRTKRFKSLALLAFFTLLFFMTVGCLGLTFSRGAWAAFFLGLIFFAILKPKYLYIAPMMIIIFSFVFFPLMRKVKLTPILFEVTHSEQMEEFEQLPLLSKIARLSTLQEVKRDEEGLMPHLVRKRPTSNKEPDVMETLNQQNVSSYSLLVGSGRQIFWLEALAVIQDHPLFGCGLNTYSEIVQRYKISWGGYPHNSYLHMMAEMGIFGTLAFLWMLVRLFLTSLRNLNKLTDPFYYSIVLGFLIGICGFCAHSFVDTDLYSVQLITYFWLAVGCVISAQKLAQNQA